MEFAKQKSQKHEKGQILSSWRRERDSNLESGSPYPFEKSRKFRTLGTREACRRRSMCPASIASSSLPKRSCDNHWAYWALLRHDSRPLKSWFEGWSDCEGPEEREEDDAQNHPQPCENEAKVVTDGAEDDVGGMAGATFKIAAAEVTFCLHMSDHRLDGEAPLRIAGQRPGVQHELTTRCPGICGDDGSLHTELVSCAGLVLADAFHFRCVEGIQLLPTLALLLRADLIGLREWPSECRLEVGVACDLAMSRTSRPSRSQLSAVAVELFGMGITPCHYGGALGDAHVGLPQPHAPLALAAAIAVW